MFKATVKPANKFQIYNWVIFVSLIYKEQTVNYEYVCTKIINLPEVSIRYNLMPYRHDLIETRNRLVLNVVN